MQRGRLCSPTYDRGDNLLAWESLSIGRPGMVTTRMPESLMVVKKVEESVEGLRETIETVTVVIFAFICTGIEISRLKVRLK